MSLGQQTLSHMNCLRVEQLPTRGRPAPERHGGSSGVGCFSSNLPDPHPSSELGLAREDF